MTDRRYGLGGEPAVAVVTGAGNGIGRACALGLAADGVTVTVADLDHDAALATAATIEADGGHADAVRCDVTDEGSCAALMDGVVKRFGHLDCAVNAAGVVPSTSGVTGTEWDLEMFDRVLAVNLRGVMLCTKHEVRHMKPRRWGSIVNVASAAAFIGLPGAPAYTASKHGVVGVTRAAGLEFAPHGIRVNALCPGGVRTRMLAGFEDLQGPVHPIGRLAEPVEMADVVRWLCSTESSFVVGAAIVADGGITLQ